MPKRIRDLCIGLIIGLIAGLATSRAGLGMPAAWTAAVTGVCAAWWVLEPIAIPATSLIPFAVFPLTGVLDHKQVAASYGHTLIILLMGGFMLSLAVEKSGVHRRMALGMVRLTGGSGRRLVLGFMLASAMCSMWISNTATVLMLLPVTMAVLAPHGTDADADEMSHDDRMNLAVPLLLGVAYAASIGGMATPVGTPPNVIFMANYELATGKEVSFFRWMTIGVPAALLLVPAAWLHLTRTMHDTRPPDIGHVGEWRSAEVRVLAIFALTAVAWIFRSEPYGGWSALFAISTASDSTVAVAAVVIMFLVPDREGQPLLDWETAVKIPWGMLLLFGGGIALSAGFEASGLSQAVGDAIGQVASWQIAVVTVIVCLSVTFLTEITSNTATTNLLMPIFAAAASAASIEPMLLMVPAALSASCAFMLPVATVPNAIVSGTQYIDTRTMARRGFMLNLIGVLVLSLVCLLVL